MGVDISPIIEDYKHERELNHFSKKTLALDAFNTIYQFLASIRQPDGTPLMDFKGNITSHLSGLFYRNINLMSQGIRLVYVFDGKPPEFKHREIEERSKRKEEAEALLEKARDMEEEESINIYAKQTIRLTKKMVEESKRLLRALGVGVVEAPSEGEAQAAYMARQGIVDCSASQDYDSLLFGSPSLVRNLSITGRRKLPRKEEYVYVHPEEVLLEEVLNGLSIDREQLIMIGLLVGSDFNKGVRGIGPKTALKIVKEYRNFEELLVFVSNKYGHKFEDYIGEVFEFFLNPPVKDVELKIPEPDYEEIRKILVEEHDFSEERVENSIDKIKKAKEKERQKSLSGWF